MVKAFEIPRSGAHAPASAPGARDNGSSVSFGPFRFDPANGLLYEAGRVHRRGYRFVAETTVEPDAADPSPAGTFRRSVTALLLAGLLLGGLAATWWHTAQAPRRLLVDVRG